MSKGRKAGSTGPVGFVCGGGDENSDGILVKPPAEGEMSDGRGQRSEEVECARNERTGKRNKICGECIGRRGEGELKVSVLRGELAVRATDSERAEIRRQVGKGKGDARWDEMRIASLVFQAGGNMHGEVGEG